MIRTMFAMAVAAPGLGGRFRDFASRADRPAFGRRRERTGRPHPGVLATNLTWLVAWWLASPLASLLVAPRLPRLRVVGTRRFGLSE